MTSRAQIRRAIALLREGAARLPLAGELTTLACAGPLAAGEVGELLAAYLLDPRAGAILATTEPRARWLEGPLFERVGAGNAAPVDDVIAALVAAPVLGRGTALSPLALRHRFAPRADDAIAIAVAALDVPAQARVLEELAGAPGPDEERLALAAVQCGRVLAWSPHLCEWPIAERVVAALLARLAPASPRPLLDQVARALAPIAATGGPLGARVRDAALAGLDAADEVRPRSFAAEVAAIGRHRAVPDLDRALALPRREVAAACAYVLGAASPLDRDAFAAHRALVLDRPEAGELFEPFVDGLVAAAHVPALAELAVAWLVGDAGEPARALALAERVPLDPIAPAVVAELDSPDAALRAAACDACALLDGHAEVDVDAALALRLGDPAPEVAAAAARVLVARGQLGALAAHRDREPNALRRAIAAAALGALDVPTVGELARAALDRLDDSGVPSPIARLLADQLLGSPDGLEVCCDLVAGVPEIAGALALAVAAHEGDVGVTAPPEPRGRLVRVALDLDAGAELAALGLYLAAHASAGDAALADAIADALASGARGDGYAGQLVAALGELRVATARTGAALAPLVARDQPIGTRVVAAAVCGRALPADHPAWADVVELLELGTIARAAAWSALRDRARRG